MYNIIRKEAGVIKTDFKAQNSFVRLDQAIVYQAKSDLVNQNNRDCLRAVMYFFLDGAGVDENDPKTFTHLCARNGLDPNKAARSIWDQLNDVQKQRVLQLLSEEFKVTIN